MEIMGTKVADARIEAEFGLVLSMQRLRRDGVTIYLSDTYWETATTGTAEARLREEALEPAAQWGI